MATVIPRFGCLALRYTCRIPSRRKQLTSPLVLRSQSLHTSAIYRDEDDDVSEPPERFQLRKSYAFEVSSLSPEERDYYNSLSPDGRADFEEAKKKIHNYMTSPAVEGRLLRGVSRAVGEVQREAPLDDIKFPKIKPGFWAMGEDEPQDVGEDEEFEGDDITSIGHAQLEKHREIREYMRIAAWEMPMLSKLAKPFSPPSLDHPLRFRYTTYMGETHPAEKKIVLEFCTQDLPDLTEAQRIKLVKLVGPRYNPEKDMVKMSCEMFETQAENKRYLGDLVNTLMTEAQDDSDTFEDVPLDFRHHKYKPKLEFPDAWKLTETRKQQLDMDREQRLLAEQERERNGRITDGLRAIETWLQAKPKQEPVYAPLAAPKQVKGNLRRRPALR